MFPSFQRPKQKASVHSIRYIQISLHPLQRTKCVKAIIGGAGYTIAAVGVSCPSVVEASPRPPWVVVRLRGPDRQPVLRLAFFRVSRRPRGPFGKGFCALASCLWAGGVRAGVLVRRGLHRFFGCCACGEAGGDRGSLLPLPEMASFG